MNKLILAIDGGATKTTLVAMQDGTEIFSATTTGSNYQAIGTAQVQKAFELLWQQLAQAVPDRDVAVACFGIAGIDTKLDTQIVEEVIHKSIMSSPFHVEKCIIENDVEAALRGMSTPPATLLIAGTGSICYSCTKERVVRAGGWGHRVGDEGSGYWIGQQIGRAIMRQKDGRSEPTLLTDFVLQGLSFTEVDELYNWLYAADYTNARLASLTSYLEPAVAANDFAALQIAKEAAASLAELVIATLQQAGYQSGAHTVYLNGGVLKHNPLIYTLLTKQLRAIYPNLGYELCHLQPIDYMIQRAQKEYTE